MNELVNSIKKQTEVLFVNADIMLKTCDLDFVLCDMPVWKHVYHMLHSCDQWFINPFVYTEPERLETYLDSIKGKILAYLASLTDESLYEIPPGCKLNRLGLILSQYRHFYAHLGNINGSGDSANEPMAAGNRNQRQKREVH